MGGLGGEGDFQKKNVQQIKAVARKKKKSDLLDFRF
jgi:hypothetical protein